MLISESHHLEADRCRGLAESLADGAARNILFQMAMLYDDMAARGTGVGRAHPQPPSRASAHADADA